MLRFHVPKDDHESPAEPGSLPTWQWTVTWEENDPRMIALPRELLWPAAWHRMGSSHHGITPAQVKRIGEAQETIVATWRSGPNPGDWPSPIWSWEVRWQATGEEWEKAEQDVLWYEAWQRMIAEHPFITPPELSRQPTPSGWIRYYAKWESRAVPGEGMVMPQTPGCYAVWHKVAAPFRASVPRVPPADAPW